MINDNSPTPKIKSNPPTKVPVKWMDDLFRWAKNRVFSTEATRKEFRYPKDERPEVRK
jgi:hypothetical protein